MGPDSKDAAGQPQLSSIGKYRIIGALGRGSMGVVYKARDPEIGRIVAIKTLRKIVSTQFQDREAALQRFRIEARSAGNLRHPNIITVFDVSIENDLPYIVMDYVEGESLDQILLKHSRLNSQLTLYYLKQIAAGLDAAHARGVIHRDIKPSNVIVDKDENVYILDFGVASISETFADNVKKAEPEPVMGTPGYMSPEQILNKDLDHRTDLFSLAVVAFECFSGRRPFGGSNFSEVLGNILNSKPTPLTSLVDLPLALEAEFEKALAKDKQVRFDSAEALVSGFMRALGLERIEKPALSSVPGEDRGPARERKISEWKSLGPPAASRPAAAEAQVGSKFANVPMYSPPQEKEKENPESKPWSQLAASAYIEGEWGVEPRGEAMHQPVPGQIFQHVRDSLGTSGMLRRPNPVIRALTWMLVVFGVVVGASVAWKLTHPAAPQVKTGGAAPGPLQPAPTLPEEDDQGFQPIEVETAPEGRLVSEMTDKEILGVLVNPASSDERILAALKEAEQRHLSGLTEAAAYALQRDSYVVRIDTIKMLKRLKDKRAVPLLVMALDDHDSNVRSWAASALGALGSRKALGYLSSRLAKEEVPKVRAVLRRAIEKINGYPLEPEKGP